MPLRTCGKGEQPVPAIEKLEVASRAWAVGQDEAATPNMGKVGSILLDGVVGRAPPEGK